MGWGSFVALVIGVSSTAYAGDWESQVDVYKTIVTASSTAGLVQQPSLTFAKSSPPPASTPSFQINSEKTYQTMYGFGGAMTESSAMVMDRLPAPLQTELLEQLFSKTNGAGFDWIRLPIGASDFADPKRGYYTYDDTPDNQPDPNLQYFDMSRDEKSFRWIRAALAINPNLKVIIAPWSPPAWMKTPQTLPGGTLNFQYAQNLANYFVRVIQEYEKRGIPVAALTIQNEPGNNATDLPSMGMSDQDQIRFIRDYLAPTLRQYFLATPIYVLDHNYSQYADVITILSDPKVRESVQGVAYHCYEGNFQEMQDSSAAFPDDPPFQTECSPMLGGEADELFSNWIYNYVLGPTSVGSVGSLAWNFVLDQNGNPHDDGCYTCKGLITADFSGAEPKLIANPEYYAQAQVSRFLQPGSRRIDVQTGNAEDLTAVGFVDTNQRVALVVWNGAETALPLHVQNSDGRGFDCVLEANAAVTFVWQEAIAPEMTATAF